jgi:hypothetical protein
MFMKRWAFLLFLVAAATSLLAYTSGIAISSDKSVLVQVFVNGKLYNKLPSNFIRIKSTEGLFHLRVKVHDVSNHTWKQISQSVRIVKGFEYQYTIVYNHRKEPTLHQVRRYPIYSRYFLNYALYTRAIVA